MTCDWCSKLVDGPPYFFARKNGHRKCQVSAKRAAAEAAKLVGPVPVGERCRWAGMSVHGAPRAEKWVTVLAYEGKAVHVQDDAGARYRLDREGLMPVTAAARESPA